jgi:phosphate/sulfate permease
LAKCSFGIFLIVFLGGVGFFGVQCLLDAFWVKLKLSDEDAWWFGWVVFSFPVFVCLAGAAFLREISVWKRVPLSITAALLAGVLGIALELAFGLWFHVAIGGKARRFAAALSNQAPFY